MTNEGGHLPGWDAGADLDDAHLAALADDQLGKRDAVQEPAGQRSPCPAAEAVRQRQHQRLAVPDDEHSVELEAGAKRLEDRLA